MQSNRRSSSFSTNLDTLTLFTVRKNHKTHLASQWVYKSLDDKSYERAEIDTAVGEFYRLILGPERAPKYRTVVQNGEPINAVISKYMPIEPMNDNFDINDVSLVRNIASLMVAAYFLEEEELQNDSVSKDGKVKINHGRSLFSLVSLLDQPDYPAPNTNDFLASYLFCFPLKNTNYENFIRYNILEKLSTHQAFNEEKFKTFLKIALIPMESISIIVEHSLSNSQRQKQAFDFLKERQKALFFTLIKMPEFISYVSHHREVISEILKELTEFNQLFTKEKDQYRQISIEAVQTRFSQILSYTKVSQPRKKTRTEDKPERKVKFAC